jgi:PEP-CTERM motif
MRRSKLLRLATIAAVSTFALGGAAQATTYNVQSDFAAAYSTSTALLAATSATWGAGSAWSAGEMSWNWTNGPIYDAASGEAHATAGSGNIQNLTTYYLPSTGFQTSGTTNNNIANIATYNYTVPFQTYQLNPGSTITAAVGQTVTQQLATGNEAFAGEKITLPANWTSNGASSGTITEVGHVENIVSTSAFGFTTTAFNLSSKFDDGVSGNTVPNGVPGVFYNYGANVLSTNDPMFNAASSATNGTVTLEPSFGPTYVAWTAPATGIASINMSAWDTGYNNSTNDGVPSLYVISSIGGPTAPLMYASNQPNVPNGSQVGGRNTPWSTANNYGSTTGTVSLISQMPGYTAALGYQLGIGWTANISVTAGEVLYFVADADHTQGNKSFEASQDPVNMALTITSTPEPTSLVLCGLGGIGLFVVAWKRRRAARPDGLVSG